MAMSNYLFSVTVEIPLEFSVQTTPQYSHSSDAFKTNDSEWSLPDHNNCEANHEYLNQ
jgi:hypothetical protein